MRGALFGFLSPSVNWRLTIAPSIDPQRLFNAFPRRVKPQIQLEPQHRPITSRVKMDPNQEKKVRIATRVLVTLAKKCEGPKPI
jgi:hypothetical protein